MKRCAVFCPIVSEIHGPTLHCRDCGKPEAEHLTAFTAEVNRLARAQAGTINATNTGSPFRAVHHDFPESMLRHYFDKGVTPQEALTEIHDNH